MVDIVHSVIACGADGRLAIVTSMHDLIVVPSAEVPTPSQAIVVRRGTAWVALPAGQIAIDHRSATGHHESIIRPVAEAVPLFWRFVREKFGIEPWVWDAMSDAEREVVTLASEESPLVEVLWPSTNSPGYGRGTVPGLSLPEARRVVARLMALGVVELWRAGNLDAPLPGDAAADVFNDDAAWLAPELGIELGLTALADDWYYQGMAAPPEPTAWRRRVWRRLSRAGSERAQTRS